MRASDLLILVGVMAIVAGVLARFGLLSWFGNLPGDIRYRGERTTVFVPITSMIVVSVALTIIINVVARWFRS